MEPPAAPIGSARGLRPLPSLNLINPETKRSRWFITVNTNKMPASEFASAELQTDLYNAIMDTMVLDQEELKTRAFDYRTKVSDTGNDVWYPGKTRSYPVGVWRKDNEKRPENIEKIEVVDVTPEGTDLGGIGIEVGPKKGRIHAHFELDVVHRDNIHLNSAGLKAMILGNIRDPSIRNIYLNFELMRSVSDELNVRKYRQKNLSRFERLARQRRDFRLKQNLL